MEDNKLHSITLEGQRKICVTAVSEVESITTESIKLIISGGKRLIVNGSNLKMGAFSKQSATFSAEGVINEIKYSGQKSNVIKKLLK
jgi:hypothetical protein